MAGRIILGIANPALNANGRVDSGATLTFYQNGTTTPQSIYSTAALDVALANPLSCDAAGRFPQIWAADGTSYSVKWTLTGVSPVTYDAITPIPVVSADFSVSVRSALAAGMTLTEADDLAVSQNSILIVDTAVSLTGDTELNAKEVRVDGGEFTCGAHALTINGAFDPPAHLQVFALADSGVISLPGASEISAKWFGAEGAGNSTTNDTTPITRAVACARLNDQTCFAPGKYYCNLVFPYTVKIRGDGKHFLTDDTGLFAYSGASYVLDIGVRDAFSEAVALDDLAIHADNGALYGLRTTNDWNGCYRRLSVKGFKNFGIVVQGSASVPDTKGDCFSRFSDVDFGNSTDAGSVGIKVRSGDGYVGPVVLDHVNGQGTVAGAELLVLDNTGGQGVQVDIGGGSWLQCGASGKGIKFTTHGNEVLRCDGFTVDSPTSTDVLIEVPANAPLSDWMVGNFSVDGKIAMPAGNSANIANRGMSEYEHTLTSPHIIGQLSFEDTNAAYKDQYATGARSASGFSIGGSLYLQGLSTITMQAPAIQLDNGSGSPGKLLFASNNITFSSGTGTPEAAVTAPVGSIFLRSNGGANTTLYVKETGTGNTGWVAK